MSTHPYSELAMRLDRLERENRGLKAAVAVTLGALVLLAGGLLPASRVDAQGGRVQTAERFEVRDAGGRVRAVLGLDEQGGVQLNLLGGPDALQPGGSAGAITMYVDRAQALLRVGSGSDPDRPAALLKAEPGGSGQLVVIDAEGNVVMSVP